MPSFTHKLATAVGAAAVLLLAGCSTEVVGNAGQQGYAPLDLASAKAEPIALPDKVLAVSPDLASVVRPQGDKPACVVPRESRGSGSADLNPKCADIPANTPLSTALFSPDGSTYIALENANYTFKAEAWIVDTDTGHSRPVQFPGATQGSSGSTSATSGPARTDRSTAADPPAFLHWESNSTVLAVGARTVTRIDASSALATTVTTLSSGRDFVQSAAFGGGRVATVLGSTLVTVDPTTGVAAAPIALGLAKGVRAQVLGVSPDGTKVLVTGTDPATLQPGPTIVVEVGSGTQTTLAPADDFVMAGAFSPDGSQVALLGGSGGKPAKHPELRLLAAAGGAGRTIGSASTYVGGALDWSRSNVLTAGLPLNPTLQAWQLTG